MRNGLEKQFISLKEIIDRNIETLGKLFTQSDNLFYMQKSVSLIMKN